MAIPSFEEYLASLSRLTPHVDPTANTPEAERIRGAAHSLGQLHEVTRASLSTWVEQNPSGVSALGLAVGLSQEKLKNSLKDRFDTTGWVTLARQRGSDLIDMLDEEFELVRLVNLQRHGTFNFGDILVARGSTRQSASRAGIAGRKVEDEIENIAHDLGLNTAVRTQFTGRNSRTASCDLAVVKDDGQVVVAVAAKGFDSTGSKLRDAVREVEEMAEVRMPRQVVMAIIDGIGWKSRVYDLRRIYNLWESDQIDGMYTLNTLNSFRDDLSEFARLHRLT